MVMVIILLKCCVTCLFDNCVTILTCKVPEKDTVFILSRCGHFVMMMYFVEMQTRTESKYDSIVSIG